MTNTSKDHIVAYVSPRSLGGQSLFDPAANLAAANVSAFRSEKRVTTAARNKLEAMGFQIERVSQLSIRVSGPAKLFQQKMGVKFEKDTSAMYLPTAESAMNALNLGSEVLEGAAFPQPIEWHAKKKTAASARPARRPTRKASRRAAPAAASGPSPTPPSLNYFHLNVPDDLVAILNAGPVHASGKRGQGVKAAMIDSGFDWSHPWFKGKGFSLSAPSPNDTDSNGHGTGESANLLAIAPKVKLHGLKMDDAVAAFQIARDDLKVKIVSNSWGSASPTDGPFSTWDPYWSLVLAEIGLCAQAGMIVLFSAGNGHMSATASCPDVISVGGVHQRQDGKLEASDYASSFNSFRFPGRQVPDVCGLCGMQPGAKYIALPIPPGCELDKNLAGGTWPNGDETKKNDGWGVFSGTSAACPMIAGVVALMLSKHPNLTLAQVRKRLETSCRDVKKGQSSMGDPAGPGRDLATGFGLVDAAAACH